MSTASITVLVDQPVARGGSSVTGKVVLHIPTSVALRCSSLEIRLLGQEKTETLQGGSSRDIHTFLNDDRQLELVPRGVIVAGDYEYPFTMDIPDGVPASAAVTLNENRVAVDYSINVYTVGKDVVRGSMAVNVVAAAVAVPIVFYALPKRTTLQAIKGQVTGSVLVGGAVETVGTSTYLKYAVVNRSAVKIKAVEATVVEEITFSTPELQHKQMEVIVFQKRVTSKEATLGKQTPQGSVESSDMKLLKEMLCGDDHRMLLIYQPKETRQVKVKEYNGPQGTYEGTIMKVTYRMHVRVFMKDCYAEQTVCGGDFVLIPPPDESVPPPGPPPPPPALPVACSPAPMEVAPVAVAAPYNGPAATSPSRRSSLSVRGAFRTVFRLGRRKAPAEAEAQIADASGLDRIPDDVVIAAPATTAPLDPGLSKREQFGAADMRADPHLFSSAPAFETSALDGFTSGGGNTFCVKPPGSLSESYTADQLNTAQAVDSLISALKGSVSPLGQLRVWICAGYTVEALQPVHFFKIFAATKQAVEQLRLADFLSRRLNTITCKVLREAAAGSSVSCRREVVQKLLLCGPLTDRAENWKLLTQEFSELELLTLADYVKVD